MKKSIMPVLILAVAVVSCSKNDDPINPVKKYLTRMESLDPNDPNTTYLSYKDGRFVAAVQPGTERVFDSAVYDASGKVISYYHGSQTGVTLMQTYVYNSAGTLVKVIDEEDKLDHPNQEVYDSVIYDAAGKVSLVESKLLKAGVRTTGTVKKFIWDASDNIVTIKSGIYGTDSLDVQSYKSYTYDSKPNYFATRINPVFSFFSLGYMYISKNNPLSESRYSMYDGDIYHTYFTYTYDADGDVATRKIETQENQDPKETQANTAYKYENL